MTSSGEAFDDDDFGEFGGFEAAEPTVPCEAKPLSSGDGQVATSWVMAAVASSLPPSENAMTAHGDGSMTKTLHDQSSVPNPATSSLQFGLDDCVSGTNWAAIGEDLDDIGTEDKNRFCADFTKIDEGLWAEKALSEQQTDEFKSFNGQDIVERVSSVSPTNSDKHHTIDSISCHQISSCSSVLDDLDLDPASSHSSHSIEAQKPTSDVDTADIPLSTDSDVITDRQSVKTDTRTKEEDGPMTLTELHLLKLQQQQIKEELQQELDKLSKHNSLLEGQRQKLKEQLDEQEQNYQLLQKKHSKELEDVRKAGHQAVSVIIEEYKELCKLAVLEQQEKSRKLLSEAISSQTEWQEALLKKQEEQFLNQLETLQEEHTKSLKETINSLQQQHQKELQSVFQEEAKKVEKVVQKAIQEEQHKQQRNMEVILEEERRKSLLYLEEQQTKWQKEVTEMKKEMLELLGEVAEEEHHKSEAAIKKALKAEREEHNDTMQTVICDTKAQMERYVNDQRQADKKMLQRSLMATDLFLDSARHQIQLLLQSDESIDDEPSADVT